MTNKQRYQRTFSVLHASEDCLMEVKAMKHTKKINISRLAAVCAAAVMVMALACAAYAADVGGIQRSVGASGTRSLIRAKTAKATNLAAAE